MITKRNLQTVIISIACLLMGAISSFSSVVPDFADNITTKIVNGNYDMYNYDQLNQLTNSMNTEDLEIDVTKKTPQKIGNTERDYATVKPLVFDENTIEIKLDYNSMSIGVDLKRNDIKVSRLVLRSKAVVDRITKDKLTILVSNNNGTGRTNWTEIAKTEWAYVKQNDSTFEIRLREPVPGRYIKLHCYIDDRNPDGSPVDKSTIANDNDKLLTVYYMVNISFESFDYDDSGNRTAYERTIPGETENEKLQTITYYPNTNRVKTDGEYGYTWDAEGNLIEKGKSFTDNGTTLTFSATDGEVWKYIYDEQNRLISVSKADTGENNLSIVADYVYDHRGYRVKKIKHTPAGVEATYYVFGTGGEILYEENTTTMSYEEFVYVGGLYFATVQGKTNETTTTKYYYITDTLGSVTAMTDEGGNVVWSNEYLAFGTETGNTGFIDAPNIYAGHEYDEDVMLYYCRARWMDRLGRYTSEDPARDGSNWYVYGYNNPLMFIDPSGLEGMKYLGAGADINDEYIYIYDKKEEQFISFAEAGIEAGYVFSEQDIILSTMPDGEYAEFEGDFYGTRFEVTNAVFNVDSLTKSARKSSKESEAKSKDIAYILGLKIAAMSGVIREGASMGLSMVPILGDIKDIQEALTGYDLVTGKELGLADWGLTSAAMLIPFVGGKMLSKTDDVFDVATGANKWTKSNLKLGQEMHRAYKASEVTTEFGRIKEFVIPGSGGKRIDFIDFMSKMISELKPNNPRAIREGLKQLEGYKKLIEEQFGSGWTTMLDVY